MHHEAVASNSSIMRGKLLIDKLSIDAKFGYLALGFFCSLVGVVLAYIANKYRSTKKEAMKFVIIGALSWPAIIILYGIVHYLLQGS